MPPQRATAVAGMYPKTMIAKLTDVGTGSTFPVSLATRAAENFLSHLRQPETVSQTASGEKRARERNQCHPKEPHRPHHLIVGARNGRGKVDHAVSIFSESTDATEATNTRIGRAGAEKRKGEGKKRLRVGWSQGD